MKITNVKASIDISGIKCNGVTLMLPEDVPLDKKSITTYLWGTKLLVIPLDQHTEIKDCREE